MKTQFQLIDVDYFLKDNKPIIRLFGKTMNNKPICVLVDSFFPYFYVDADENQLKKFLASDKRVREIRSVKKFPGIGFRKEKKQYLKIILYSPKDVRILREVLESQTFVSEIFEADILFKYRFLIDHDIRGMQWIEVDGNVERTSASNVFSISAKSLKVLDIERNSDLKFMSFDIECLSDDITRPLDSKKDPIIMISLAFTHKYKGVKKLVLVSKKTTYKPRLVRCFDNEKDMLEAFLQIIHDYDPDVITGYNSNNFDIPYVLDRLESYNIPPFLGRANTPSYCKKMAMTTEPVIVGRVVVDPYQLIKRDPYMRLERYDLNTVARQLLGDEKKDVKYTEMAKLWNSRDGLKKFIDYSEQDALLALKLLLDINLIDKFYELSKVSGVLLQDSFGGQTVRVEVRILHEFKKKDFIMPSKPSASKIQKRTKEREESGLKGATVLEPKKGLHIDGCTMVLDFKSLYPSLMITYNISPDSLLIDNTDVEHHVSPTKDRFVDKKVREGILPYILKGILKQRSEVKKMMSKTTDDSLKKILDARQLALKIMMNSYYGYTGYLRARLYTMSVASSITGYGRENIVKTKKIIEEKYGLNVIYGDTDSVFVFTNEKDLNKVREMGTKISEYVTKQLDGVLELEFEKIYRTFLILTKKRYVGWKFEFDGKTWKDKIEMKGIETVRRDWPLIVTDTMNKVIEFILKEGDIGKAKKYVIEVINQIKEGKIDISKLVVIKGVQKNPESYKGHLPHIELAKKINKRNPENPLMVGQRIGYVIVKGNEMLSKRAETPEYIKEHNLEIDSDYYIERQLLPPIERIFEAVNIDHSELIGGGRQVNIFEWFNGPKRVMKHNIEIKGNKEKKEEILDGVESFVCEKCKREYKSMPISGKCICGGNIKMSFNGKNGNKIKMNFKK